MNSLLALQRRLSSALRPVSKAYAACMRLRAKRWRSRLLSAPYRAACPVVSVGNIGWGGSGKTPLTDWLLLWAGGKDIRAVVLTRGYKAKPPSLPFPVRPDSSPEEAGDEPLLLARRHPGALVVVDPKRPRAAAWAEANDAPRLFVLDDGMQHLAMGRDLDLVLLRPEDLVEEWDKVIPSGSWREGAEALSRAAAFCIKADPRTFSALAPLTAQRLAPYGVPVFPFHLAPQGLCALTPQGVSSELTPHLEDKAYVLVSGVGSPDQVRDTAETLLSAPPAHHAVYADHHAYTEQDAAELTAYGLPLVCTAKDAVKLEPLLPLFGALPVWVLEARPVFGTALFTDLSFPEWWEERWQELQAAHPAPPPLPPLPPLPEDASEATPPPA